MPAHASLFTGLFPREHGANIETEHLHHDHRTLAELLAEHGYRTAGFSCNPWIAEEYGFAQGFEYFQDVWREGRGDPRDTQGAALAVDRALEWIEGQGDGAWFAFLNLLEPHAPYRPPPPWRYRFVPDDIPLSVVSRVSDWSGARGIGYMLKQPGYEISEQEFTAMRALYDGELAYQDGVLGDLVAGLRERGVLDQTLLAIVADHGEQLGEHGMVEHKVAFYQENVRVPLVIRYPGLAPAGRRVAELAQAHDLFATLLHAAGLEHAVPQSARALPLSPDDPGRDHAFVEFARPHKVLDEVKADFPDADVRHWDRSIRVVRDERFKLIAFSDGERRLFDLERDPGELENLAERLPDRVRELEAALAPLPASRPSRGVAPEPDGDQLEALRALGYLTPEEEAR